jgi:hypothetical protein
MLVVVVVVVVVVAMLGPLLVLGWYVVQLDNDSWCVGDHGACIDNRYRAAIGHQIAQRLVQVLGGLLGGVARPVDALALCRADRRNGLERQARVRCNSTLEEVLDGLRAINVLQHHRCLAARWTRRIALVLECVCVLALARVEHDPVIQAQARVRDKLECLICTCSYKQQSKQSINIKRANSPLSLLSVSLSSMSLVNVSVSRLWR